MSRHAARTKTKNRLNRQLSSISHRLPVMGATLRGLLQRRRMWLRLPVGLCLVAGGLVGFLPVLGFWMVPLGLMLLAVDLPFLRPLILKWVIVGRRRLSLLWRRLRGQE